MDVGSCDGVYMMEAEEKRHRATKPTAHQGGFLLQLQIVAYRQMKNTSIAIDINN